MSMSICERNISCPSYPLISFFYAIQFFAKHTEMLCIPFLPEVRYSQVIKFWLMEQIRSVCRFWTMLFKGVRQHSTSHLTHLAGQKVAVTAGDGTAFLDHEMKATVQVGRTLKQKEPRTLTTLRIKLPHSLDLYMKEKQSSILFRIQLIWVTLVKMIF